jgi:hypothetical protein
VEDLRLIPGSLNALKIVGLTYGLSRTTIDRHAIAAASNRISKYVVFYDRTARFAPLVTNRLARLIIVKIDDSLTACIEEGLHTVITRHGGGVTGMHFSGIAAVEKRVQLSMYRLARITSHRVIAPPTRHVCAMG